MDDLGLGLAVLVSGCLADGFADGANPKIKCPDVASRSTFHRFVVVGSSRHCTSYAELEKVFPARKQCANFFGLE